MTRTRAALAAVAALALTPAAASAAADPSVDFIGTLRTPRGVQTVGLEVRRTPGGYQGRYDAITLGYRDITLRPAPASSGPAFDYRLSFGALAFHWDPGAGDWAGAWRDKTGAYPMRLRRGVIPPGPAISRVDAISLAVIVSLMVLEAAGIARLLQLRRRRRLRLQAD